MPRGHRVNQRFQPIWVGLAFIFGLLLGYVIGITTMVMA